MTRLGTVAFRQESLQRANGNRTVDLPAPACGFTGVRADTPADAGHRIGIAGEAVGFFEAPFRDQRYVPPSVGVRRTSHHAGEVGVQPLPINLFLSEAQLHSCSEATRSVPFN